MHFTHFLVLLVMFSGPVFLMRSHKSKLLDRKLVTGCSQKTISTWKVQEILKGRLLKSILRYSIHLLLWNQDNSFVPSTLEVQEMQHDVKQTRWGGETVTNQLVVTPVVNRMWWSLIHLSDNPALSRHSYSVRAEQATELQANRLIIGLDPYEGR